MLHFSCFLRLADLKVCLTMVDEGCQPQGDLAQTGRLWKVGMSTSWLGGGRSLSAKLVWT